MFAYFVDRPVLAGVISVLVTLIGAVAGFSLPIAQFPEIAPPIINIQATYPGATAQQAYEAIAIPLEQEINGAQGLIYISSTSNADGSVNLDATFEVGSDLNAAAADVLTRAQRAESRLPQAVRDQGLEIVKSSRQRLGNVVLFSDDNRYDELFLSNWAETQVIKPLRRVTGMGRIVNFSNQRYAMRIWLDRPGWRRWASARARSSRRSSSRTPRSPSAPSARSRCATPPPSSSRSSPRGA